MNRSVCLMIAAFCLISSLQSQTVSIKEAEAWFEECKNAEAPDVLEILRTAYRSEIAERNRIIQAKEAVDIEKRLQAWQEREEYYNNREKLFRLCDNHVYEQNEQKNNLQNLPYLIDMEWEEEGKIENLFLAGALCSAGYNQGTFVLQCYTSGLDKYNKIYLYIEDEKGNIDESEFLVLEKSRNYLLSQIKQDNGKTKLEELRQRRQLWDVSVSLQKVAGFKRFVIGNMR
ncbi:MAG: hypothetical protein LBL07_20500 [Tannerella sp.]|nr:hypothetical protein [Tannerella sp.]